MDGDPFAMAGNHLREWKLTKSLRVGVAQGLNISPSCEKVFITETKTRVTCDITVPCGEVTESCPTDVPQGAKKYIEMSVSHNIGQCVWPRRRLRRPVELGDIPVHENRLHCACCYRNIHNPPLKCPFQLYDLCYGFYISPPPLPGILRGFFYRYSYGSPQCNTDRETLSYQRTYVSCYGFCISPPPAPGILCMFLLKIFLWNCSV